MENGVISPPGSRCHRQYAGRAAAAVPRCLRWTEGVRRLTMNGYLKIDVGPFWRILSKDGCRQWWLMDHETYNREIRR
ncbi:Uncharacterised protein [Enterobacter cloacae]|uniref:ParE-like toxin domain-containing protein n=1 Tax=Enterobacter cloacae TaxID=550 RepID=A0A377M918_ENTCL|nr:Uncharacterised protein [Enterobacter cloacae]